MDVRSLRYLVTLARMLNFTAAASHVHISQPSLSRQIQKLEGEIGVQLFSRDRRNVTLTEAGRYLAEEAGIIVAQTERFLRCAEEARKGAYGLVRVANDVGLNIRVEPTLNEYRRKSPGVVLTSSDVPSDHLHNALMEGKVDVGIVRGFVDSKRLIAQPLFDEAFVVVVPRQNQLAKFQRLTLTQVRHEPLVLGERVPMSPMHDKVLDLYQKAGIEPTIIHVPSWPHFEATRLLIGSGAGIGVGPFPRLKEPIFGRKLGFIPLDEPNATMVVNLVWRRGEVSAAVVKFVSFLRQRFKEKGMDSLSQTELQAWVDG